VLRGEARRMQAYESWRGDTALAREHGGAVVSVEVGKVESRTEPAVTMTLRAFLERYESEQLYLVSPLPPRMAAEVELPPLLAQGGFDSGLALANLWLSSGGTSSVVHADDYDGLNCLMAGVAGKRLWLAHPRQRAQIESAALGWGRGASAAAYGEYAAALNASAVDVAAMPGWLALEWVEAELAPGDCIFIPAGWYHHVRTEAGRSLAVNIWWERLDLLERAPDHLRAETLPTLADCSWGLDSRPEKRVWTVESAAGGGGVSVDRRRPTICNRRCELGSILGPAGPSGRLTLVRSTAND
jgi:lysine-specific demethylase 8